MIKIYTRLTTYIKTYQEIFHFEELSCVYVYNRTYNEYRRGLELLYSAIC